MIDAERRLPASGRARGADQSGNANALTGPRGSKTCTVVTQAAAQALGSTAGC